MSLYDDIGGAAAVHVAVGRFYIKLLGDSMLAPFFDGVSLEHQRAKQVAFLTMAFGGPSEYDGHDLREAHKHLVARGLTDAHFDAVAGHLRATLVELKVDPALISQVLGVVAGTKKNVLDC
jgi:hemoglobin